MESRNAESDVVIVFAEGVTDEEGGTVVDAEGVIVGGAKEGVGDDLKGGEVGGVVVVGDEEEGAVVGAVVTDVDANAVEGVVAVELIDVAAGPGARSGSSNRSRAISQYREPGRWTKVTFGGVSYT